MRPRGLELQLVQSILLVQLLLLGQSLHLRQNFLSYQMNQKILRCLKCQRFLSYQMNQRYQKYQK